MILIFITQNIFSKISIKATFFNIRRINKHTVDLKVVFRILYNFITSKILCSN